MKVLELFSGTGSISKVCKEYGWDCISLDRDMKGKYKADITEDIMTWDYTIFKPGEFDLITASPVCLFWSKLRFCNINQKRKDGTIFTREILENDIEIYGKPMVDKIFEILDYFKPSYWWIENPKSSSMRNYINEDYYVVDYCMYGFKYKKPTRIWTNIKGFIPKECKQSCPSIISFTDRGGKPHNLHPLNNGGSTKCKMLLKDYYEDNNIEPTSIHTSKFQRYRIPYQLIREFFDLIKN